MSTRRSSAPPGAPGAGSSNINTSKPPTRRTTELRFSVVDLPPSAPAAGDLDVDPEAAARRARSKSISKIARRLSKYARSQSMANVLAGLETLESEGEEEEMEGEGEEEDLYGYGHGYGYEDEWGGEAPPPPPTPTLKHLKREYVADVGGGVPRSTLLKMDEPTLKKLIKEMVSHVERVRAENIVLERTLDAMEARDREIEAMIPKFSYRYPWEELHRSKSSMQQDMRDVCSEGSTSDEEDDDEDGHEGEGEDGEGEGEEVDANAQIFHPETDLNLEDPMFAGMSENSREELQRFMLDAGEIAPPNFDVMKYKYANLIRGATAGDGGPNPDFLHDHTHHHHHGHGQKHEEHPGAAIYGAELAKAKEPRKSGRKSSGGGRKKSKKSTGRKSGARRSRGASGDGGSSSEDSVILSKQMDLLQPDAEEPEIPVELTKSQEEFPDFDPMAADELPLKFKNRFIEEQIPLLIAEWREQRLRQTYKDSTRVLVYIDTYQTSYIIVKQLLADLRHLHEKSVHPITKRLKAESLLLFMRHIKNYLSSEAMKHSMEFNELRKHKHRIDTQLKQNEELGESLHLVDFEQLRIENKQLVQDIEENHDWLQRLKIITAKCMEDLKHSKSKLFRQLALRSMLEGSIQVRINLQGGFERETEKKKEEIWSAKGRIRFFRQRLRAFRAPNLLEYIGTKAEEHGLSSDLRSTQRKIDGKKKERTRVQNSYPKAMRENMRDVNQKWFDEIKKEVDERQLMKLLGECDDADFEKKMEAAGSKAHKVLKKATPAQEASATGSKADRKSRHKSLLGTIHTVHSGGSGKKTSIDMDDAALVKSRLPIPTPGNLLMLSQQQEKEDTEIARLSRIKSEAKSAKSARLARRSQKSQEQAGHVDGGRRPSTASPGAPAPEQKTAAAPRPSVIAATATAHGAPGRKSVAIAPVVVLPPAGQEGARASIVAGRKSVVIAPESPPEGGGPRASIVRRTSSPTIPAAATARLSKRRMTISEVKTRHMSKIKDEDQLIMKAGALFEAAAHQ